LTAVSDACATGLLAFTSGANPGRTVNAAAMKAAIADTESTLIITVPSSLSGFAGCLEERRLIKG
jgi:hypothetical protein